MSHQRPHQDHTHYPPHPGTYYPPQQHQHQHQHQQHQGYQGYFNQGFPYTAAPLPPPNYQDNYQDCQYEENHHHHHHHRNEHGRDGCFSFLQGCLAALCCCCMMEECCFCLRCCL